MTDTPTPRASGSLAVFEITCEECIERLDGLAPSEEQIDLKRQVGAMLALFRSWDKRPPAPEERAQAVSRLMDLHRAVEELATRR
jgi:hypothetical protein